MSCTAERDCYCWEKYPSPGPDVLLGKHAPCYEEGEGCIGTHPLSGRESKPSLSSPHVFHIIRNCLLSHSIRGEEEVVNINVVAPMWCVQQKKHWKIWVSLSIAQHWGSRLALVLALIMHVAFEWNLLSRKDGMKSGRMRMRNQEGWQFSDLMCY